ncbi:hypothetical protein D3C76_919130 [compost metagenome]
MIRQITELVALEICLPASSDSAAAMVTTSAPRNENMVISMALSTAPKPLGMKPPVSHRRETPLTPELGNRPKMAQAPRMMKPTMAATFTSASQNSNSP